MIMEITHIGVQGRRALRAPSKEYFTDKMAQNRCGGMSWNLNRQENSKRFPLAKLMII